MPVTSKEVRLVDVPQVLRQRCQKTRLGPGLHGLIRLVDGGVVVLHGCGHVSGDDLACVVEEAQDGGAVRVQVAAVAGVAQACQRVGNERHVKRVLREVLGAGASHEGPALDVLHAGEYGQEMGLARPRGGDARVRGWPLRALGH